MPATVPPVPVTVTVRFWAAAKAAAGRADVEIPVSGAVPVEAVLTEVVGLLADRVDLERVLAVCSFLVGDRPGDRSALVGPGQVVEVLPPFAGG